MYISILFIGINSHCTGRNCRENRSKRQNRTLREEERLTTENVSGYKRLHQHKDSLIMFLKENCDCHNNKTERAIRPNVTIKKTSEGNKSEPRPENHETMMSVYETHKLRNEKFLKGAQFMRNQLGLHHNTSDSFSLRLNTIELQSSRAICMLQIVPCNSPSQHNSASFAIFCKFLFQFFFNIFFQFQENGNHQPAINSALHYTISLSFNLIWFKRR